MLTLQFNVSSSVTSSLASLSAASSATAAAWSWHRAQPHELPAHGECHAARAGAGRAAAVPAGELRSTETHGLAKVKYLNLEYGNF